MTTLAKRGCVARQEPYIPGALSILQGTVPGRVRGPGHMVPTYFRRCSGIECFNGHRGFALYFLPIAGSAPMSAIPSKAELRAVALAAREALSDPQRAAAAQALAGRGLPVAITAGMVVSGYAPI